MIRVRRSWVLRLASALIVQQTIRPAIFKWRQTAPELILCAVRWHLRSSLPFREAAARLWRARGLLADHTTLWRWVQRYGPELAEPRRPRTPTWSPLTKAAQVERDSGFDQQRAALEELTDALEAAVAPSGPARRAPESRD